MAQQVYPEGFESVETEQTQSDYPEGFEPIEYPEGFQPVITDPSLSPPEEPSALQRFTSGPLFQTPEPVSRFYESLKDPEVEEGQPSARNIFLNIAESISTPVDAALIAGTGGAGLLRSGLSRAAGGLLTLRGGQRMLEAESPMDVGVGALEAGGGMLGMRAPRGRIPPRAPARPAASIARQTASQWDFPEVDARTTLRKIVNPKITVSRS